MQSLFGGGGEDVLPILMMRNRILSYYLILFGCLCLFYEWFKNIYKHMVFTVSKIVENSFIFKA